MRLETVGKPRMLVNVKGESVLEMMKTVIAAMDE